MEDKKPTEDVHLSEILSNSAQTFFKLLKDVRRLFDAELRLASKSLLALFILGVAVICLLTTMWLGLLAIFVFIFRAMEFAWLTSLFLANGINLLILVALYFVALKMISNLTFHATRKQLHKLIKK